MLASCSLLPSSPTDRRTTRQAILAVTHRHEGVTKTELANALELGWGTVTYHLDRLQRDGLVQVHHSGRNALLFPAPRTRRQMETAAVCRRPAVQRILALLRSRTELTIPRVMQEADLSRFVARSSLDDMEEVGLVVRVGGGRPRYRVPDTACNPGPDLVPFGWVQADDAPVMT